MRPVVTRLRRAGAAICVFWLVLLGVSAAAAEPAIWRVEGGPRPVYLFGTFHLLPPEAKWQTPAIAHAFEKSDVLTVEVRLDAAAMAEAQKVIKEKAFLKDDKKLRDYLSPEDQVTYEMIGNRLGMFPAILDNYKPWYASLLLASALYLEQGFRPDAGVDNVLQKRAEMTGKPVAQLETATQQMNFLAGMSEKEQVGMLKAMLSEAETVPEQVGAMLQAWIIGDTEAMDELLNTSLREFPGTYDRLLVQRNRNWLTQIETMIKDDKGYFVAVGVGHLVGKDSVVAMLRAKGYEITGP